MVQVIQTGITKKDIPYEAQIIRVADEYDAIVTERHYKTHINISETLKDLIKNAQPDPRLLALDNLAEKQKDGKINGYVLKKLFKVVIDDTLYEISGLMNYVDYLKNEVKRLELIHKYDEKAKSSNKEKTKNYYTEGMRLLFKDSETFDNYKQILDEYNEALSTRTTMIKQLYDEIKIIKKLKV